MEQIEKVKKELKDSFLDAKKDKLVSLLIDFIENKATRLIENPENLKVLTFEYWQEFDFKYVGFPDPNIISENYWLDQFHIDASENDDNLKLKKILANHGIVEDEHLIWIDAVNDKRINIWEIFRELELVFFSESWQIAKKKTNSNYRCFFLAYEINRGIDADTGKSINSYDIINVLTEENSKFKILQ